MGGEGGPGSASKQKVPDRTDEISVFHGMKLDAFLD